MKMALSVVALTILFQSSLGSEVTPIGKVVQLLTDLEAKIIGEGEAAHKVYAEFAEWCEDRSKTLQFEIKTGNSDAASLKATMEQETATTGELNAKIERLEGELATDDRDLQSATEIRAMEKAAFDKAHAELSEVVDTLKRAIAILEREMAKSGASMLQFKSVNSVAQALSVMVQASMISSADGQRLAALVQNSQESADSNSDDDINAPAAAVYKGQSDGIINTLQDLLAKAEAQLDTTRKTELSNHQNFEKLEQALQDEIKFGNADRNDAIKGISESSAKLNGAKGDLSATTKELNADASTLGHLHQNCMTKAQDYEAATKSREEELKALAEAKKVIRQNTGASDKIAYGLSQVSFLQFGRSDHVEVARLVRDLAQKQHSSALALLASRIDSAMRSNSGDPFVKVKGLIVDMIARLEGEAEADASHKAYCDKELAETNEKKADKTADIEKISTKIDQMTARSAQLKGEVAGLQKGLAELLASQAEMTRLRGQENALFTRQKADMEQGLEGVKVALKILRQYYSSEGKAHEAAEGAGEGVIGLLEVVESDFSKTLAEIVATETSAAGAFEQESKDNQVEKTSKDQDVKYKSKESSDLDKAVAEASADRSGVQTELDAVKEYLASLLKQCTAIPEKYSQRKSDRAAEIAGLREALAILEGETSFLQENTKRALRSKHH